MADSNDSASRIICTFLMPTTAGVRQVDLGRSCRQVRISCATGASGDELMFATATYEQLVTMATDIGWRRLGPLPDGSYILEQVADGPIRYICFQWATGGITTLPVVIEGVVGQQRITPGVVRTAGTTTAKP
jgi:hypothetical protein